MQDSDAYTDEDWYRITGTLTPRRIERILDLCADSESFEGVDTHVSEAMNPFDAEDFLSDAIELAAELKASVRGANRETAERLHAMLEDIARTTFNAMDYANSELDKALEILRKLE